MSDGWDDYRRMEGLPPYSASVWSSYNLWSANRVYGEEHNAYNRAAEDAITERHRHRTIRHYGRIMLRADLGLPEPESPAHHFWLGREGHN